MVGLDCEDCHQEKAMGTTRGMRMKNPAHKCGCVNGEIVGAMGLSVTRAAEVLGVMRQALPAPLGQGACLTPPKGLGRAVGMLWGGDPGNDGGCFPIGQPGIARG